MEQQTVQLAGGGQLMVREEQGQVVLEAVRPNDGRGLYKVWAAGARGRQLLGTLVPEGERLFLRRRLPRSQLERAGCWPVTGGECVMAFSFQQPRQSQWVREERAERLVRDEVLRRALRGKVLLLRRGEEGFRLAARFDPSRPFPVPALVCLGETGEMQGRTYVFFRFDRDGTPIVPHKPGADGDAKGVT